MQAKRKLLPILLIVVLAAVVVAACSSGGANGEGRTWFNLPAVPLNVKPDGSVDVYGLGVPNVVLPASTVQQIQGANAQRVEARAGHNGIHVYVNGQDLPYLNWDDTKFANLLDTASKLPGVGQYASYLPWTRRIGLGVALKVPPAQGAPALDIPRWTGETSAAPETPEKVVGPLDLGLVSFDANGEGSIAGISAAQLSQLTGANIPLQLTPDQLALIKTLGLDKLTIKTQPNGTDVSMNEQPQLTLAYDSASLQRLADFLTPFLQTANPAQAEMVKNLLPALKNLDATIGVNFNGQPGEFKLGEVPVMVGADGALNVMGLDLPGAALPASTVKMLQDANAQQIAVNATGDSLGLAVNGQSLPKINFTSDGLNVIASTVGSLAGVSPELITTGLNVLTKNGLSTTISVPPAEGQAPVEASAPAEATFAPPDLGGMAAPVMHIKATVKDGQIATAGGLTADQLAELGVTLPALPPMVTDLLSSLGAKQVDITNAPNNLQISINGTPALTIQHDAASLLAAWNLAKPFLNGTAAADPALQNLIETQILPLVPGADLNVSIAVE